MIFYQICTITCFSLIVGRMGIVICSSSFSQITSNHKFLRVRRGCIKYTEPRQCCQLILGSSQISDIGAALIELCTVLNICFSTGSIVLLQHRDGTIICRTLFLPRRKRKTRPDTSTESQNNSEVSALQKSSYLTALIQGSIVQI